MRRGLRIAFTGAGGTGKTSTVNKLAELDAFAHLPVMKSASRVVYENKKLTEELGDAINGQYEIVFEQGSAGFALPGTTSTEVTEGIHGSAPLQRLGVSPEDGKDSICYQQTDT